MTTHPAIVTIAAGAALAVHQIPTSTPLGNEVLVLNQWTASTPLDLHQADGGLLVNHPQVLGDGVAGTVVSVGPQVNDLKPGDKVFGFTWRNQKEKAHQLFVCAPENILGKLPEGFSMQQGVVLGNNFVTAWHTINTELGITLPWPKPETPTTNHDNTTILIWGGSSSVGQYAIQILKFYGYNHIIATASKAHHDKLKQYGAEFCFDYHDKDISTQILNPTRTATIQYAIDCIGSLSHSMKPLSHIAQANCKVAIMLPVIIRDASPDKSAAPIYSMDVRAGITWAPDVDVIGVRTHFYTKNEFLNEKLQSEIMPECLRRGIVKPNDVIVVEGETMLERAEKALSVLRARGVSGKRLVWRIAEEEDVMRVVSGFGGF